MAIVKWGKSESTSVVESIEELEALLDRLHLDAAKGEPILVTVERVQDGDSLTIGVGREMSVLNFVSSDGDPPYFISRGDNNDDDQTVHFYFMGSWSEFPLKNTVPLERARAAIRHFWKTGVRDPTIGWEEV